MATDSGRDLLRADAELLRGDTERRGTRLRAVGTAGTVAPQDCEEHEREGEQAASASPSLRRLGPMVVEDVSTRLDYLEEQVRGHLGGVGRGGLSDDDVEQRTWSRSAPSTTRLADPASSTLDVPIVDTDLSRGWDDGGNILMDDDARSDAERHVPRGGRRSGRGDARGGASAASRRAMRRAMRRRCAERRQTSSGSDDVESAPENRSIRSARRSRRRWRGRGRGDTSMHTPFDVDGVRMELAQYLELTSNLEPYVRFIAPFRATLLRASNRRLAFAPCSSRPWAEGRGTRA